MGLTPPLGSQAAVTVKSGDVCEALVAAQSALAPLSSPCLACYSKLLTMSRLTVERSQHS